MNLRTPNVIIKMRYAGNMTDIAKIQDKDKQAKYARFRQFYSCAKGGNYVNYISGGIEESKILDYLAYAGNSEKSAGVFNQNGLMDNGQLKELKKDLRKTQSPIWDGIISFEEQFGKSYCKDLSAAQDLLRVEFPKFLKANNMNLENVVWYAGLHTNKDHNHIHFSFYEREPLKRSYNGEQVFSKGKIPNEVLAGFKVNIQANLTGLTNELKLERMNLRQNINNFTIEKIDGKELGKLLKVLSRQIPRDGKIGYASENMNAVRLIVNKAVDLIIAANPEIEQGLKRVRENIIDNGTKLNLFKNKKNAKFTDSFDALKKDIYRRIGNKVIEFVVEKRKFYGDNYAAAFDFLNNGRSKRVSRKKVSPLDKFFSAMQYSAYLDQLAIDEFADWIRRLKYASGQKEIEETEM